MWKRLVRFRYKSGRNEIFYNLDRPSRPAHFVQNSFVVSGWALDLKRRTAPQVRVIAGGHLYRPAQRSRKDVQQNFEAIGAVPSACGFEQSIELPLGIHRLRVEIETSDGAWMPLYNSLMLHLPFDRHRHSARSSYQRWVKKERALIDREKAELRKHCDIMLERPKFSIIVEMHDAAGFRATEASLQNQIYRNWEIHALVRGAPAIPPGHPGADRIIGDISQPELDGEFLVFIRSGDELACNALYEFASALNADPALDMIYADESGETWPGRQVQPFFKPDWSPDYLETFNYVGHPACYRASLARQGPASAGYYDFVLRFTEQTDKIHHIGWVLVHRPASLKPADDIDPAQRAQDIAALNNRLARTERTGNARAGNGKSGYYHIDLELRRRPLVSIVIPTAGKVVRLGERNIDLIVNCVSQIRSQSTYRNIEIVIVDNGDLAAQQRQALEKLGCRFITFREPELNIAKKLNLGVSIARGEMLILLNDDIELVAPDWIERMLEHFEKKHVGVVGAKLLYPNNLIQHAGVIHDKGQPCHVRRFYPRDDEGYFFSTCGARNFMAVTGACMMTPLEIYRRVGGYSEELPINFNDVDYCLKVRELGLFTVYAPRAELVHLESQSHRSFVNGRELNWYQVRWARETAFDPFYNETRLTIGPPTFEPSVNPRLL